MTSDLRHLIEKMERPLEWLDEGGNRDIADLLREAIAALRLDSQTSDLRHQLEAQIEDYLNALDKASYSVDARERHNSFRPVYAMVVDRSDVLHWLLFLRQTVRNSREPVNV